MQEVPPHPLLGSKQQNLNFQDATFDLESILKCNTVQTIHKNEQQTITSSCSATIIFINYFVNRWVVMTVAFIVELQQETFLR